MSSLLDFQNAQTLMNVVFFVLIKIEILTRGTFSSIAIELKMMDNAPYVIKNWTDRLDVKK